MKRNKQRGSALIFALILLLVLSAMAGSLMFLSTSETYSSSNYRMMTQARYGAEAGINAAANFLMSANYVPPPAPAPGTEFAGYNTLNAYPVQLAAGGDVVLTTIPGRQSTYPDGQMVAAFQNAMNNPQYQPLQAGANTVNFYASAKLLSMISVQAFGTTQPATIQTWQITAHGDITYVRNAEAEVVTTLERYISPAFSYAAFADGGNCGQLTFTGNGTTNGYDSTLLPVVGGVVQTPTSANFFGYGGDVGTNGNENDSGGNVQVNGTLSTPNLGFGNCTAGNLTALTANNLSQVTGGLVHLSQAVTFPPPNTYPPGATNISLSGNASQTLQPGVAPCSNPCSLGTINITAGPSGGKVSNPPPGLTLSPGVYNIDSLSISGNGQITIAPDPITGQYGPVVINVAGTGGNLTPITITGNAISNPTYDPSLVQITYAGTGTVQIAGKGACAAVVYAPNAIADFKGNGSFYGSVIAEKLTDVGNGQIYYDLRLKKKLYTIGNYVLNAFTWNKY